MDDLWTVQNGGRTRWLLPRYQSGRLFLTALLFGIIADVLFYEKTIGVSAPIAVALFYLLFLWNMGGRVRIGNNLATFLTIPVALLSLTYLFFSDPVFAVLNVAAIPVLIVLQTTLAFKHDKPFWEFPTFIANLLYGIFCRPLIRMLLPFAIVCKFMAEHMTFRRHRTLTGILTGIVVTIPLLIVIISLLSSADKRFEQLVGHIPTLIDQIDLYSWIPQFLFIVLFMLLFFSYTWSLIRHMRPKHVSTVAVGPVLDPVTSLTILTIINAIYLLFTLIQFTYLFGSLPDSLTYAEYARRGFFELVAVTLINFTILLALLYGTRVSEKKGGATVRIMESLLVFCTLIMLVSAFIRMYLYEQMYGFTYLRVLTHAFMIFLFVLLWPAFLRIWSPRVNLCKCSLLIAVAAYVLINYANIDALIAGYNIDRYHRSGKIDTDYLATLSDDAVPKMTELLHKADPHIAERVESDLAWRKQRLDRPSPWQSFNFSHHRANAVLSRYYIRPDANNH